MTNLNFSLSIVNYLKETAPSRIAVHNYGKVRWLETNEITHLRGDGNYTYITLRSREKYIICKTLKTVQETSKANFVRVHKSFVVNPDQIMVRLEADVLLLKCGTKVPIARRRMKEIDDLLAAGYLSAC